MYFYTPEAILLPEMMVLKNATPFGMTIIMVTKN
nr:MAG TPA: hypothetical protein [Caudoviricetes sp.]